MPSGSTLLLFAGATLLLLALPGPSVLYVVARTVEQGRAAGLVSVLGLETGALIHVARGGGRGVGARRVLAGRVRGLRFGGAAYLLWLARADAAARAGFESGAGRRARRAAQLFRDGVMVDLLNPKTALFFLAFLPGFVRAEAGPVAARCCCSGGVRRSRGAHRRRLRAGGRRGCAAAWAAAGAGRLRERRGVRRSWACSP